MFKYGFSLEHISELSEFLLKKIYSNYNAVELNANDILNDNDNDKNILFLSKYMKRIDVVDLIPSHISKNIQTQNIQMQKDFITNIDDTLTKLNNIIDINSFSMHFADNNIEETLNIIKKLYPLISHYDKKMLIPLRLPFTKNDIDKYYSNILQQIMHPKILLSLDINPHEFSKEFNIYEKLKLLNFHIGKVRIIYEPQTGNQLTVHILDKILSYLSKIGYNDYIFFVPKVSEYDFFIEETIKIKKILK